MNSIENCFAIVSSITDTELESSNSPPSYPDSPNGSPISFSTQTLDSLSIEENATSPTKVKSTSKPRQSTSSPIKPEPRIKRPMNAFMVWSQQRRQQISATGQKFHNSDISKMLGAEWRKMDKDEKTPFVDRAKQLREEHFREHPDYVYRPRRRQRTGRSSGSVDSVSTDEASGSPTTMPNNLYTTLLVQAIMQYVARTNQTEDSSPPQAISSTILDQLNM